MQNYLEYIDAYFQRTLEPEEIKRFENKITEDKEFADEVAFYLSAKQSLRAEADLEKKVRFRELLAQERPVIDINQHRSPKRIWLYRVSAAAAVLICVFFAWYFFFSNNGVAPQQMADKYINENFKTLSVTMGKKDSLQEGLRLYNEGQYNSALRQFESMSQRDENNYLYKNYIGIIYLRLGNYDKALQYFRQFENDTLYSNPSKFQQALTLLKRNLPGDKQKAKELLQQVNDNNLEGKETAQKWLDKW
jgi:tetratricopeptide (TPR) repeat protein